ncbi:unnamed protein product [Schistocephalus solidus]|uniref:Retrotrans_gag domain-containing protein n=1 Tax=Schistocephalus solidus TaxID=70667 RepID=A0A183T1R3_SCHSO|nr:unnamed protein product [Schistocephalus solidus]
MSPTGLLVYCTHPPLPFLLGRCLYVSGTLQIGGSGVLLKIGDNFLGKLVKELQKLTMNSAHLPEKLTRETNFARWEARCKVYLQGLDARAHSGAILALLDDEVYDLALSADISAATAPSAVLDGLREILGSFEHPWVLQADFHRRYQQPGESINDFQQALRLFGRRAFPTLNAKALSTRVLEQLVAGVHDPQIRKILFRDRPPTLEKALALAREEEVLQAVCEQPSRSLFGVTAVQPHSSRDASSQSPRNLALVALFPGEETGVGPGPDDHKEPKPAAPSMPLTQAQNPLTMRANPSHMDDTQIVEHYLEVPPEGGYALPEVFNSEQQVEKLVEVPPEGGSATELVDAAEDSRVLL